jgi:hypothetical protein
LQEVNDGHAVVGGDEDAFGHILQVYPLVSILRFAVLNQRLRNFPDY